MKWLVQFGGVWIDPATVTAVTETEGYLGPEVNLWTDAGAFRVPGKAAEVIARLSEYGSLNYDAEEALA